MRAALSRVCAPSAPAILTSSASSRRLTGRAQSERPWLDARMRNGRACEARSPSPLFRCRSWNNLQPSSPKLTRRARNGGLHLHVDFGKARSRSVCRAGTALSEEPERPAFKNERGSEPHMTVYPVEFHRRSEQKWAHRAELARASEGAPRPRGFVRQHCIKATEPERERLDGFPVSRSSPNRSKNASAYVGSAKQYRT